MPVRKTVEKIEDELKRAGIDDEKWKPNHESRWHVKVVVPYTD